MIFISFYGNATQQQLDYCASAQAWTARKIIATYSEQNPELNIDQSTSVLISRTLITDNGEPIVMGEWGQLYNQLTKIIIPYKADSSNAVVVIATSIISDLECSLSEPSYIELSMVE